MVSRAVLVVIFLTAFLSFIWPRSFGAAAVVALMGFAFTVLTLYSFRDPNPRVPGEPGLVVAPGHGKVDVVDELEETTVMRGRCRRISIHLSVFDVKVQRTPVGGDVTLVRHSPGQSPSALNTESATRTESVLIGLRAADPAGTPLGVRLIAGLIALRILPWIQPGDSVVRGDRISMMPSGSRVDLLLPLNAEVRIRIGQRVVGGETVLALLP